MAAIPSLRTGTGRQPLSPYMLKILDDTVLAHRDQLVVEMNPVTAEQLELKEGDLVEMPDGERVDILERAQLQGFEDVTDADFDVVRKMAKAVNMPPYQEY